MKKITLAEKIAGAEKRIANTGRAIIRAEIAINNFKSALRSLNRDIEHALIYKESSTRLYRKVRSRYNFESELEDATGDLKALKKRLISQRQYLRKLLATQAEIERQDAEEDAYIDAMITLAGAIA